jgi:hypothetical protein
LRGRAIRELLLCQPVPNPPSTVNFSVLQDTGNPRLRTARARLTAHDTDPLCSGCHALTDLIGLPLEKFDGIGAWRANENGARIDTRGVLAGTRFTGAAGLGKALATTQAAASCVVRRALEYALGRSVQDDTQMLAALDQAFAADGYQVPALLLRIATLPAAYQIRRAAVPDATSVAALSTQVQTNGGGAR